MSEEKSTIKLSPCPFCGETPAVVTQDLEAQSPPWYGQTIGAFVLCDCGACMFDQYFHDGFCEESDAIAAWNKRAGK